MDLHTTKITSLINRIDDLLKLDITTENIDNLEVNINSLDKELKNFTLQKAGTRKNLTKKRRTRRRKCRHAKHSR